MVEIFEPVSMKGNCSRLNSALYTALDGTGQEMSFLFGSAIVA
jgi:hypothetical protein